MQKLRRLHTHPAPGEVVKGKHSTAFGRLLEEGDVLEQGDVVAMANGYWEPGIPGEWVDDGLLAVRPDGK